MLLQISNNSIDYKLHNEEVSEVWDSYYKGSPIRIPMILGLSSRYFIFNSDINPERITYKEYTENPDIMFEMQVRTDCYRRINIPADYEMGIPGDGWTVYIDFQNYYEAVWLGSELRFIDNNVPAAVPFLNDDNKNLLFHSGIPDPFSGLMGRGRDYYELFQKKARSFSYNGARVGKILPAYMFTDGPFTIACDIRGTTEFCFDLHDDPDYAHRLLEYITDATICRIKAWRKFTNLPEVSKGFNFADDSILLLSCEAYKEFVLPYHRKLINALSDKSSYNTVHLCGDATRHFRTLRDELDVKAFDTGFPVNHGKLVRELGPDVAIYGGPHVELLRTGTTQQVDYEVKRIIGDIKAHTSKFVLRDANNIAPYTPVENISAMYEACRKYGIF